LKQSASRLIQGSVGNIEILVDEPDLATNEIPKGLALIAHPHPLYGGTFENKVVQTLARTFAQLGYVCWRPNFRGVGKTDGQFDEGKGESEDLLTVFAIAQEELKAKGIDTPAVLAGFSFGSFVQTLVAQKLDQQHTSKMQAKAQTQHPLAYERLVLLGPATTRFAVQPVRADTIVIHGEKDEVVPLVNVFEWARPQALPIIVVPDSDHFFNRKLTSIKQIVLGAWGMKFKAE
jgi:uncharacterized protein